MRYNQKLSGELLECGPYSSRITLHKAGGILRRIAQAAMIRHAVTRNTATDLAINGNCQWKSCNRAVVYKGPLFGEKAVAQA